MVPPHRLLVLCDCLKQHVIFCMILHLTLFLFFVNMSAAQDEVINPTDVLAFMNTVGKLKHEKRTGWVRAGIHLPESVGDHMYKMSMLVFMIRDQTINRDRLMKSKLLPF
jgi:hypothetical protein